jgi:AcrR family transcriptional regulator
MDLLAEQKAERKSRILAAARQLIEEVGYEGLTIRDLAKASRVSVPTLYKFFGDKDSLLMNAVEDQFGSVMQSIGNSPGVKGLDLVLAVIDGCCREMVRTNKYSKAVLAIFVRAGKTSSVMNLVGRDLTNSFETALIDMAGTGELEAWVDPRALAERLTAHQIMVSIEWESGDISNKSLYPKTAYGAGMMLLGVTKGKASKSIAKLLKEVQVDARARKRNTNKRAS